MKDWLPRQCHEPKRTTFLALNQNSFGRNDHAHMLIFQVVARVLRSNYLSCLPQHLQENQVIYWEQGCDHQTCIWWFQFIRLCLITRGCAFGTWRSCQKQTLRGRNQEKHGDQVRCIDLAIVVVIFVLWKYKNHGAAYELHNELG